MPLAHCDRERGGAVNAGPSHAPLFAAPDTPTVRVSGSAWTTPGCRCCGARRRPLPHAPPPQSLLQMAAASTNLCCQHCDQDKQHGLQSINWPYGGPAAATGGARGMLQPQAGRGGKHFRCRSNCRLVVLGSATVRSLKGCSMTAEPCLSRLACRCRVDLPQTEPELRARYATGRSARAHSQAEPVTRRCCCLQGSRDRRPKPRSQRI